MPYFQEINRQNKALFVFLLDQSLSMEEPTANSGERKIDALRAHASQTAHMDDLPDRVREWMTRQAAEAGLAEGRLAEAFMVVNTA